MRIQISNESNRRCGDCQLCCKLLPMQSSARAQAHGAIAAMVKANVAKLSDFAGMVEEFDKPAGVRCPHQHHGKGCAVYSRRPFGCRMWHCRWVQNDDTAELQRPDRSHYVIDSQPDFVTSVNNETGERQRIPVIQVWLDPDYPDAHRDPKLRAFLARAAEQPPHAIALIRLGRGRGFTLWPPSITQTGEWHESEQKDCGEKQHSFAQIVAAVAGEK
jgi:Putative zinc- or iron-chelating domain